MKPYSLLLRLAWRHAWRRPLQSLFLILGVSIGVAMIVAIDLANGSAQRAFQLGTESVAGRSTHQIVGGPKGLSEQIYIDLRRQLDYQLSAPIVEEYVVATELDAQPVRLLGVDPFSETPFRSYLGARTGFSGSGPNYLPQLMARSNTILMSNNVAQTYGLSVGDKLTIRIGGSTQTLEIVGLLEPSDELSRRALDGLLIADIATAQELFGRIGVLDRIDLILPEGPDGAKLLTAIQALLPPNAQIERASARVGTVDEMTKAFRLNLTALSLLALVVGLFLIYNTVTFSVIQRRQTLGSLRSLGMTQEDIFGLILAEAGLLGILGTALGLVVGVILGIGAVRLVTQTMNDLFFVVAVREIDIPLWTMVKGTTIGIGAALIGAAIPAYEATNAPPIGSMQRSQIEEKVWHMLPWVSLTGVGFLLIGAGLLIPEWHLIVTFIGLFAVILGCALLTPLLTLGLMIGIRWFGDRFLGVVERMAPHYVIRSISRTSVAVAALMVAVSVIIGVGVMISSFRTTVEQWLSDVLQADIYVMVPGFSANQGSSAMDQNLVEHLAQQPGVIQTATTRGVNGSAYLTQSDATQGNRTQIRLVALSRDLAGENRRYRSSIGNHVETWQAVQAGGILINEPMSNRMGLRVGDEIILQTDLGHKTFEIVGVAIDFDVNFVVLMYDQVYRQFWDDDQISGVALFIDPLFDLNSAVTQIRASFAGERELIVRSNRSMRQNALDVFDRTFAITVALQLLATLVAFIGILSTLMSLQLERAREIGVLRANGMTRGQLWRMSLLETGLIGSSAGLLAIPTGFVLAVILIYIINLRSFGWTLELQLQPEQFLRAFGVSVIAALLASLYPAWWLGKMEPADAVRGE